MLYLPSITKFNLKALQLIRSKLYALNLISISHPHNNIYLNLSCTLRQFSPPIHFLSVPSYNFLPTLALPRPLRSILNLISQLFSLASIFPRLIFSPTSYIALSEYHTASLFALSLLLFPFRTRLYFTINHNLSSPHSLTNHCLIHFILLI